MKYVNFVSDIYIVGFLLLVVIGIIYGAYKVLLFRQTLPRVTDYPPTLNYNPPPTKKGSRSWAGGQVRLMSSVEKY